MAGFDLDYNAATDFQQVSDGTYEVVINGLKEDATQSGAQYINVDTIIRNDIQGQPFQNNHVFRRIFAKKETGQYPKGMLFSLGKAAGIPDGTHFKDLNDYMDQLYHKPLMIRVKNETSEYQGKTYENTNIKEWKVSKFPKVAHKFKAEELEKAIDQAVDQAQKGLAEQHDPFQNTGEPIDISNDDLPF